jgi:excinuclease UvrABC ATPase subunit
MPAKPKYNFRDTENLLIVEGLARDGYDNKHIAEYFNYTETYFSELVNSITELSEALKKGRRPLEVMVENSLFRRAFGGIKLKTQVRRFLEQKCECEGYNKKCQQCKGTGKKIITDVELVQETVTELPPDTGAAALWLKQKKPDIWNKQPIKLDTTTNGKDLIQNITVEVIDKREDVISTDE